MFASNLPRRGVLFLLVWLTFTAVDHPVSGHTAGPGSQSSPQSLSAAGQDFLSPATPRFAKSTGRLASGGYANQSMPARQEGETQPGGYRYTPLPGPSPLVAEMMARVDEALVLDYMRDLTGERPVEIGGSSYTIRTRNSFSGEPIQKAAAYLNQYYQGLGFQTELERFSLPNGSLPAVTLDNVIAQWDGSLFPERLYMITSHYDNNPRGEVAPGADDNASGTVGVMLAADILSQYDFACSLRFANFAGEEQGLYGSKHSARLSDCRGEAIQAVLNLDMIGWNTAGSLPGMDLHANRSVPGSVDVAKLFADVVETYNLNLDPQINPAGIGASDHASYWTYDIPAILVIEDLANFNPNYHNTTDRLSALKDLPYFIAMIKASLGTIAHMSCLIEEAWGSLAGVVSDAQGRGPIPGARILITNPEWGYTFVITSVEQGYFQRTLLPGEHIIEANAPGYKPAYLSGINISPGQQTRQDILLQPSDEALIHLPLITGAAGHPIIEECE